MVLAIQKLFQLYLLPVLAAVSFATNVFAQVRSTQVVFTNSTPFALQYNTGNLGHGIWTVAPPQMIQPGATVHWKSESNGAGTGTEGIVNYRVMDPRNNTEIDGEVIIHWINPFVGSNDLKLSRPVGLNLLSSGNSGNNCVAYIRLVQEGPVNYKAPLFLPHDRIYSLQVRVKTSSNHLAGTDNHVYFSVGAMNWELPGTFEAGQFETFNLNVSNVMLHTDDIVFLQLEKKGVGNFHGTSDFPDGEWEVDYVELWVNNALYLRRNVARVISSPQSPFWREVIQQHRASDPNVLFYNTLRLLPNEQFVKGQAIACATTYQGKLKGISGWLKTNTSPVLAEGRVLWPPTLSSDGLVTIDLQLHNVSFWNDQRYFPINRPSYIRIEYWLQNSCIGGLPEALNQMRDQMIRNGTLPTTNSMLRVQGEVWWDTDDGGHFEIHARPGGMQVLQ